MAALAWLAAGLPGVGPLAAQQVAPTVLRGPQGLTEIGVLDGAAYRIDVPPDWNHSLIVYYHGYAQTPVTFHVAERVNAQQQPFLDRHYAIAQSAYSETGWALQQGYPETEELRKYFAKSYQTPKETYAVGTSLGGVLVSITMEINPKPYLGGLDLCGSVGPSVEGFQRRFAQRAAFDHYFPGVMPPLVPTPRDFEITPALRDRISAALKANPAATAEMRSLMELRTETDVANDIAYFTFVIGDMQRRAGGNPFDTRNYLYTGTNPSSATGDYELNDKVQRYAASPAARAYVMRHYTPSGHLGRPMLAVHTLYDPLVPPTSLALYDHTVQEAGAGESFVQQYVHAEGHCNISGERIGHAFDELVQWTHGGPRPVPGLLKDLVR